MFSMLVKLSEDRAFAWKSVPVNKSVLLSFPKGVSVQMRRDVQLFNPVEEEYLASQQTELGCDISSSHRQT